MRTNRLIQCAVLLHLLGLVGAEIRAEPTLLVEIHDEGFAQRGFVGQPLYLDFVTEVTDHTTQAAFGDTYDAGDVGMTFTAPPETVADMEAAFHARGGRFWLHSALVPGSPRNVDEIWNPPPTAYATTLHVPRLGHGLSGYHVTSVTQTIDRLRYAPDLVGDIYADFAHTISLYGEAIPEPSCLLLFAHIAWVLNRRWRYGL